MSNDKLDWKELNDEEDKQETLTWNDVKEFKWLSKRPMNMGEWIIVILTLILIGILLWSNSQAVCQLDCSTCNNFTGLIEQTYLGR